MSYSDLKSEEIDRNLAKFLERLPSIVGEHEDEYALMRHGEIIDFFPSAIDAQIAGNTRFDDAIFSIQHVTKDAEVISLWPVKS